MVRTEVRAMELMIFVNVELVHGAAAVMTCGGSGVTSGSTSSSTRGTSFVPPFSMLASITSW
jgi:hypothetical protein